MVPSDKSRNDAAVKTTGTMKMDISVKKENDSAAIALSIDNPRLNKVISIKLKRFILRLPSLFFKEKQFFNPITIRMTPPIIPAYSERTKSPRKASKRQVKKLISVIYTSIKGLRRF